MAEISYQLYSSRDFPPLANTLAMLKALGYERVEAYGGLFGDPDGLADALAEAGLAMPSAHIGLDVLESEAGRVLAIAGRLGIQALYCPHIAPDQRPSDADGWRAFGARLEAAGRPVREAGMTFGWHNHDFEFAPLPDGSTPMQHLLAGGPSLCWEADIAWIARGGADPLEWIGRYGDRIRAAHVKDIAPPGECADEDGWADVGHGTLDWPGLLRALGGTGAELLVMEHDKPSDDARFARRSIEAVRAMRATQ